MKQYRRSFSMVAAAAAAALVLTACGSSEDSTDDSSDDSGSDSGAFPVTIEHGLGETVIEEEPQNIVTWGWSSTDAVLALGEVPVGIPAQPYGGDADGVLPWIGEALDEAGARDNVTILPSDAEAPVEDIAALEPDLILAPYSGITQAEYDLLSEIAPTVAYPEVPWATPWRDVITITAESLGRPDDGATVISDIEAEIAEQADANPDFEGVTVAQVLPSQGEVYVYLPADARVEFTEALGFVTDASVTDLDTGEAAFYVTVSPENLDEIAADLVIVYGDAQETIDDFLASDEAQLIPAVAAGNVAAVVGQAEVASVSPPTALSLPWGLDSYVSILSEAVSGLN